MVMDLVVQEVETGVIRVGVLSGAEDNRRSHQPVERDDTLGRDVGCLSVGVVLRGGRWVRYEQCRSSGGVLRGLTDATDVVELTDEGTQRRMVVGFSLTKPHSVLAARKLALQPVLWLVVCWLQGWV